MDVKRGELNGYVKPIFKNVHILNWKETPQNPLKVVWETVVAGVAELLTNQPKDQIAKRIPLSGDVTKPDIDVWATIGELLRNAFIQALFPGLEGFIKPVHTGRS